MTDLQTIERVNGEELNSRMVYLKPSVEMRANLLREKKSSDRQLVGMGIVCFVLLCWLVTR